MRKAFYKTLILLTVATILSLLMNSCERDYCIDCRDYYGWRNGVYWSETVCIEVECHYLD